VSTHVYLPEDEMIRRAVGALIRGIGPIEAGRFLALPRVQRLESVQRHQQWQETLDKTEFFEQIFGPSLKSE